MQCFLILGTASCKAEILFYVIDISFYSSPDFVSVIPFFGSADCSGISTKILFRIDVDHAPARQTPCRDSGSGRRAWISLFWDRIATSSLDRRTSWWGGRSADGIYSLPVSLEEKNLWDSREYHFHLRGSRLQEEKFFH